MGHGPTTGKGAEVVEGAFVPDGLNVVRATYASLLKEPPVVVRVSVGFWPMGGTYYHVSTKEVPEWSAEASFWSTKGVESTRSEPSEEFLRRVNALREEARLALGAVGEVLSWEEAHRLFLKARDERARGEPL